MISVRRILLAIDFSSYSNQAYFHAVALAEKHRASLTILYVFAPNSRKEMDVSPEENNREYWRNQLVQVRPLDTSIPVEHVLLDGDPPTQIVKHATHAGMDLIVMGTHGRSGVERLLMGSVAEKVLREAPCTVMVVKLPRRAPVADPAVVIDHCI